MSPVRVTDSFPSCPKCFQRKCTPAVYVNGDRLDRWACMHCRAEFTGPVHGLTGALQDVIGALTLEAFPDATGTVRETFVWLMLDEVARDRIKTDETSPAGQAGKEDKKCLSPDRHIGRKSNGECVHRW